MIVSTWRNETIRVEKPELRIIDEPLWARVHARLTEQRAVYLRRTDGRLWGRPSNSIGSKFLLTGLLRCGACGSGLTARSQGRKRTRVYACMDNLRGRRRGPSCSNTLTAPMALTDGIVLTLIQNTVLRPEVVTGAIAEAVHRVRPETLAERRAAIERDLKTGEQELAKLMAVAKAGGDDIESLVKELRQADARTKGLEADYAALTKAEGLASVDLARIEAKLTARLREWHTLLLRHTAAARQILLKLIPDRLTLTPHVRGAAKWYTFEGQGRLDQVLQGLIPVVRHEGATGGRRNANPSD